MTRRLSAIYFAGLDENESAIDPDQATDPARAWVRRGVERGSAGVGFTATANQNVNDVRLIARLAVRRVPAELSGAIAATRVPRHFLVKKITTGGTFRFQHTSCCT
jgi:hypothetical protein